ncbi:uncharacterized protein BDZ83DRAFT_763208 [Colletotrichum acutatum]|uniref:Uncharacterized protein n=1 Tax=Glomerella acutata TaxID=27357 RepID=A0AAD8XCR9_GLOAC|nr:uncharacterized protein BDZ83DRAFT_763208 [Colletotrichum acutatum]KAK1713850.1 hypothetical protein BDZ83DRAFT_763208 [Colletotrichum acutatum]
MSCRSTPSTSMIQSIKSRRIRKGSRNYGEFVQDEHPALFSITFRNNPPERRRILGQLFSRSNIEKLEGLCFTTLKIHLGSWKKKYLFDVGPACRALEADIICETQGMTQLYVH